ncbi:MAG: response regulator transcription factor [Myxococcales bacterium]|nr:response regulator transcription factor [Myxococcales bacterium]
MSTSRTLLVIDDDGRLRELLAEYLSGRGFGVLTAESGERGLEQVRSGGVDLVILDVMMPGMDGFEVMKALRRFTQIPVVMLTARGDELDRIIGLEIGADDYLPKPFNPRELLARIQAVLRRHSAVPDEDGTRASAGPLMVDSDRRLATLNGTPLDLTTTEFDILRTLVTNAGRVIPRERLMELARGEDYAAFERSVDVHVSHIRKKIGDDPKRPTFLKTVRGIGYTIPKDPG